MAYIRIRTALAAILVIGPAWAATPAITDFQSCAKVADDKARLACFDRIAAQAQQADTRSGAGIGSAGTASTGAPGVASGAAAAASGGSIAAVGAKLTPEQKIGLPRGTVDKLEAAPGSAPEPQLQDFEARIRSVSVGAGGREVFALENDQVWRQSETKPDFSVRPGDTVRISRGALGSFWLSANVHSATRVSRIH
jgi:hypothetical protein